MGSYGDELAEETATDAETGTGHVESTEPLVPQADDAVVRMLPVAAPIEPVELAAGGGRRRRWPRVVAVAAAVAVVAGLTTWGVTEHASAQDWKSQQQQTAARLRAARATERRLRADLASTRADLKDAQQLGEQLAQEKADLQDQRTALADVLGTVPATTDALDACSAALAQVGSEALDVAEQFIYTYNVSFAGLDAAISTSQSICADAYATADQLEQSISDLGL